jgi:hypothetical protein
MRPIPSDWVKLKSAATVAMEWKKKTVQISGDQPITVKPCEMMSAAILYVSHTLESFGSVGAAWVAVPGGPSRFSGLLAAPYLVSCCSARTTSLNQTPTAMRLNRTIGSPSLLTRRQTVAESQFHLVASLAESHMKSSCGFTVSCWLVIVVH